jgi:excisionase family DNA binding protein
MLRSSELAKEVGLSKQTVLRLAASGVIPCSRLPSGHYRFDLEEVKAALRVKDENEDQ